MLARIKTLFKEHAPSATSKIRLIKSYWTGRRWIGKGMNAFREIFETNTWNDEQSVSGSGSSLEATEKLRMRLPHLLETYNIRSILDAPCGDFHWMSTTPIGMRDYTGIDIVSRIVENAARRYTAANRRFVCLDISEEQLPNADLIICRDCLVHFSFADVWRTLRNFARSGATFLLTTTYPRHPFNVDCPTGHWRALNLELPPFNFPPPLETLGDDVDQINVLTDKSLGFWTIESIKVASGE